VRPRRAESGESKPNFADLVKESDVRESDGEVVEEANRRKALEAVKRNQGAPGIDYMRTTELENHLQAHWDKIRAKLLAGTWVPSPVRRVEIPKPSGGTRMLGIPTVMDRFIQQMLLPVLRRRRKGYFVTVL